MDAMVDQLQQDLPTLLPRLWRFALRLTREKADAEDLVQRCWLRALERRAQWRSDGPPLSWLFSIMHSIWLNELRARKCKRKWTDEWDQDQIEQYRDVSASRPEDRALYNQVVALVETLPDEQRNVLVLVAVEGLSYKEAAQVLSVPVGTVMSRLARARLAIGKRVFDARVKDDVVGQ
jgi:RNA polymerase sigma-70 factor (ECF subfamily)